MKIYDLQLCFRKFVCLLIGTMLIGFSQWLKWWSKRWSYNSMPRVKNEKPKQLLVNCLVCWFIPLDSLVNCEVCWLKCFHSLLVGIDISYLVKGWFESKYKLIFPCFPQKQYIGAYNNLTRKYYKFNSLVESNYTLLTRILFF